MAFSEALIFRFFKSFTTNPRLDVVIQTVVDCTPNVVPGLRSTSCAILIYFQRDLKDLL